MDFDSSFGQEKFVGIAHFEVGEFGFEIRAINVFIPAHSDVAHVSFFDLVAIFKVIPIDDFTENKDHRSHKSDNWPVVLVV